MNPIFLQVLETRCPAPSEGADSEPLEVEVKQPSSTHIVLPELNSDLRLDNTAPQTEKNAASDPPLSESDAPPLTVTVSPLSTHKTSSAVSETDSSNDLSLSNSPLSTPLGTPPSQQRSHTPQMDTPRYPRCIEVESSI